MSCCWRCQERDIVPFGRLSTLASKIRPLACAVGGFPMRWTCDQVWKKTTFWWILEKNDSTIQDFACHKSLPQLLFTHVWASPPCNLSSKRSFSGYPLVEVPSSRRFCPYLPFNHPNISKLVVNHFIGGTLCTAEPWSVGQWIRRIPKNTPCTTPWSP